MLGIGKLAAGAEDYYLGIAAGIEDYYVGIASPGQWIGSSQQLDIERLGELLGRARSEGLSEPERNSAAARMLGPEGLTGHASTFDRRDLLRAWCEAHPQGATLSEVQFFSAQMIANEPSLIALAGDRWTTKELLACEQSVLDAATRGVGLRIAVVPSTAIDAAIAARPTITAEQEPVARALVGGGGGVAVLIAPAGTGKGFTLGVAQAAWSAAGVEVLGATVAARAAAELRTGAGIGSMTMTSLIGQLDDGKALARNSVLVIDEASMVGTRQLARLVQHAASRDAKVVLVGDPRQLPEIDAGGVLGGLAQRVHVLGHLTSEGVLQNRGVSAMVLSCPVRCSAFLRSPPISTGCLPSLRQQRSALVTTRFGEWPRLVSLSGERKGYTESRRCRSTSTPS